MLFILLSKKAPLLQKCLIKLISIFSLQMLSREILIFIRVFFHKPYQILFYHNLFVSDDFIKIIYFICISLAVIS